MEICHQWSKWLGPKFVGWGECNFFCNRLDSSKLWDDNNNIRWNSSLVQTTIDDTITLQTCCGHLFSFLTSLLKIRTTTKIFEKYVKYVKQQYFCCFSTSCIKSKFCWLHLTPYVVTSLFRNSGCAIKLIVLRNASKFAIFYIYENPKLFSFFHFILFYFLQSALRGKI